MNPTARTSWANKVVNKLSKGEAERGDISSVMEGWHDSSKGSKYCV